MTVPSGPVMVRVDVLAMPVTVVMVRPVAPVPVVSDNLGLLGWRFRCNRDSGRSRCRNGRFFVCTRVR